MVNFTYYNPTRIIFGKGVESDVGTEVKKYTDKVLLHYGGGSIKKNGVYDRVTASLKKAGVSFVELGGVTPNPRLSLVKEGIALCKKEQVGMILAVGGGSTIDSSKAIGIGARFAGDMWEELFMAGRDAEDMLPVGVVLTIPAAGSESSDSCVITNDENGYKRAVGGEALYPKFAFMNPEITFTMSVYQIACGASDILAHLMERYFTNVKNTDFVDRMIEATMRTILINTPKAVEKPTDYDVRAEIMWAGTVAHNNLLSSGRIGDWASHSIEHELSGKFDIAHGAGLSIIFPAWMKYVYRHDVNKFVQLAVRVFDVDVSFDNPEHIVSEMIRRLEDWYRRIGLPVRLSEADITRESFEEMADKCLDRRECVGKFVKLLKDDVKKIYELAD